MAVPRTQWHGSVPLPHGPIQSHGRMVLPLPLGPVLCQRETWQPIDDASSGSYHAAVVWDVFKLFMSTLEVFFGEFSRMREETGLPAPVRGEWVNDLAFRMFIILNKLLNTMRQERPLLHTAIT